METKIKTLNYAVVSEAISGWLKESAETAGIKGFVIGVSGGIDSAVVSTLCARTGLPTLMLEMPIHQGKDQVTRARKHIELITAKYKNTDSAVIDLTETFEAFKKSGVNVMGVTPEQHEFSLSNSRSRIRMTALYQFAGQLGYMVAGTGNKVEDFGIGFYTKYGDGGVDISPIGDLMKSEVYELGRHLGIIEEILTAAPTDGLHSDGRTDEDQIGATYDELEWAMKWTENSTVIDQGVGSYYDDRDDASLTQREKDVLEIYWKRHSENRHKMNPIPVFYTVHFR
jgi:NAD+ synthase